MNYTTKQIAEITQSQLIGDKNLHVQHIAFDSRNIYSVIKPLLLPSIQLPILEKNTFRKR